MIPTVFQTTVNKQTPNAGGKWLDGLSVSSKMTKVQKLQKTHKHAHAKTSPSWWLNQPIFKNMLVKMGIFPR